LSEKNSIFNGASSVVGFESLLTKLAEDTAPSKTGGKSHRGETVAEAKKEAEKAGFEEGFQNGHADGFRKGLKEGQEQGRRDSFMEAAEQRKVALGQFTAELDKVQLWFREAIDEWFTGSEQRMTDLAVEAVKAVLQAELAISRESALGLVREILHEVTHARRAKVRINPFDSVLLQQHRAELIASSGSLKDIELVDDPTIMGGCIIETEAGVLDASFGSQLASMQDAIRDAA
jgi:flagellar assembly protein FliH